MNTGLSLERYLTFINSEPARRPPILPPAPATKLAVTISRQSGSGAHVIAAKLAEYLQARVPGDRSRPWTVFDRNLVEKVLEEHHLPEQFGRFMPEDGISPITDTIDELFGLHPPSWMLTRKTAETIRHLAEEGNVILIGRGANIITGHLEHVFHVRLLGSLEKRVAHFQETQGLDRKAALERVAREDRGRRRYLKKNFNEDPDNPSLY